MRGEETEGEEAGNKETSRKEPLAVVTVKTDNWTDRKCVWVCSPSHCSYVNLTALHPPTRQVEYEVHIYNVVFSLHQVRYVLYGIYITEL